MTEKAPRSSIAIHEIWNSIPRWERPSFSASFLSLTKRITNAHDQGVPVDMDDLWRCLCDICNVEDNGNRLALAESVLSVSGPLCFDTPWDINCGMPIRAAINIRDTRLIDLFHRNGAVLRKDDFHLVGRAIGSGFWCLPELIFPQMQDSAPLDGFVYSIMNRCKETPEEMDATLKTIEGFAKWACPESLPERITAATTVWQAKAGNLTNWITGKQEYQLQTLAALVKIGLDINEPIKSVKMNRDEDVQKRRDMYRAAVPYALADATPKAKSSARSHRL